MWQNESYAIAAKTVHDPASRRMLQSQRDAQLTGHGSRQHCIPPLHMVMLLASHTVMLLATW